MAGGNCGDQRGLVVAARAGAVGVDGDRNEDVAVGSDPLPAPGDRASERLGEASFAGVLQLVQRSPNGAGEGRTPLELEERLRNVGREAERRTCGKLEASIQGGFAGRA